MDVGSQLHIVAIVAVMTGGTACAGGASAPPPFRGPVVSSISVGSSQRPAPPVIAPAKPATRLAPARSKEPAPARGKELAPARGKAPAPPAASIVPASNRGNASSVRTIVAQSPSPAVTGTRIALVGKLRALVGQRDKRSNHVRFVVRVLGQLGANLSPDVRKVRDGEALIKLARRRTALMTTRRPRLGDIIVFDNFLRKKPSSMTAIVVSIDQRGTVEFIYLSRKVVRRGFMNLRQKSTKRDGTGKVLNVILRHLQARDRRSATRYLAGQLFTSYISLRKLTR